MTRSIRARQIMRQVLRCTFVKPTLEASMRLVVLTMLLLAAGAAHAQRYTLAGDLEPECKLAADGNAKGGAACIMVIDGFVNGYMAGAKRGVRTAFFEDQQNLSTTQGIDDVTQRVTHLYPSAKCFPELGTTKQVADVFVTYLKVHPQRRKEHYGQVLADAVESYFCPSR